MIGIFDSGLGGLTVVKEVLAQLPGYGFTYFGDTARMPYGPKGGDTVRRYSRQNAQFLVDQGAKAVIIACNTASAFASEDLAATCPVPVFDVVGPAVRRAAQVTRGVVGIIGTRGTVGSGVYARLMGKERPDVVVHAQACPLLVPLVEEGWHESAEARSIATTYLEPLLLRHIDTLILGCTHYPFLEPLLREIVGPDVTIVDPARETVAAFRQWLLTHPDLDASLRGDGSHRYVVSDASGPFAAIAKRWLSKELTLAETRLE
jgi:glutamate racemase